MFRPRSFFKAARFEKQKRVTQGSQYLNLGIGCEASDVKGWSQGRSQKLKVNTKCFSRTRDLNEEPHILVIQMLKPNELNLSMHRGDWSLLNPSQ
jgi:hypothetical protein